MAFKLGILITWILIITIASLIFRKIYSVVTVHCLSFIITFKRYQSLLKNSSKKQQTPLDIKKLRGVIWNKILSLTLPQLFGLILVATTIMTLLLSSFTHPDRNDLSYSFFMLVTSFTGLVGPGVYLNYWFKCKASQAKIGAIGFGVLFIFIFSTYSLYAVQNSHFNSPLFFIFIGTAMLYNIFLFLKLMQYDNHTVCIITLLLLYFWNIFGGAFIFGTYYYHVLPDQFVEPLASFNSAGRLSDQAIIILKMGLPFFFELPEYGLRNSASLLQFFWGKFIELCLLGYVVTLIYEISNPKKPEKKRPLKRVETNTNRIIVKE